MRKTKQRGRLDLSVEEQKDCLREFAVMVEASPYHTIQQFLKTDQEVIPLLGYIVHTKEDYMEFLQEMYDAGSQPRE